MTDAKIHVYFMPGMAANPSIFRYIDLPHDTFTVHLLEWFVPMENQSLSDYAEVMNEQITHDEPVLVGVSFGGLLVQEMAKQIKVKKVVIISSIKHPSEMPKRMRLARYTKVHRLLPTGLVNNIEFLAKYALGDNLTKRLDLYQEYLSIRDKRYIDWSIDQIVNWKAPDIPMNLVHIHGEKDPVFPIANIKDCIPVRNGTHTMIIHRAKWFNEHLATIILQ